MAYGYLSGMRARPGCRGKVVEILLSGKDGLREAGCDLYVVGLDDKDPDAIWVSEVWKSKEHHDDSLLLPGAKEAIAKAIPMLTGAFTTHELTVVGGLGVE